jgi:hypothetical protein
VIITSGAPGEQLSWPESWMRFSARTGSALAAGGMFWLSRITEHSTYAGGMLGPELILGTGMGLVIVPTSLVILNKVDTGDAGAASSLFNVGQQVGGSIGLAILGTVAWSAGRTIAGPATGSRAGQDGSYSHKTGHTRNGGGDGQHCTGSWPLGARGPRACPGQRGSV